VSRSSKKGPYVDPRIMKKVMEMNAQGQKKVIKIWARSSSIAPEFVNHTFAVHNGKKHIPVFVSDQMVGHKFGEFAPTRTFKGHAGSRKK